MNNYLVSLIRTYVPIGVGLLLTWLASTLHIVVTQHSEAVLIAACVAALSAAYYALVRLLEKRFPAFGLMLGAIAQPAYSAPAPAAAPFHYTPTPGQ